MIFSKSFISNTSLSSKIVCIRIVMCFRYHSFRIWLKWIIKHNHFMAIRKIVKLTYTKIGWSFSLSSISSSSWIWSAICFHDIETHFLTSSSLHWKVLFFKSYMTKSKVPSQWKEFLLALTIQAFYSKYISFKLFTNQIFKKRELTLLLASILLLNFMHVEDVVMRSK